MSGSGQMASFMTRHRKKEREEKQDQNKKKQTEGLPTRSSSSTNNVNPKAPPPCPPHPLLGPTSSSHGARCTAAGADVTHDATFVLVERRQRRECKCGFAYNECVSQMQGIKGAWTGGGGGAKWVRDKIGHGSTVGPGGKCRPGPLCTHCSPQSVRVH